MTGDLRSHECRCGPCPIHEQPDMVPFADPDTPTTSPGVTFPPRNDTQSADEERPDAPVDDGLVEQIARVLAEHRWSVNRWACLCGWTPEPRPGRDKSGVVRHGERNSHDAHLARALVVARPWQAEVEAARLRGEATGLREAARRIDVGQPVYAQSFRDLADLRDGAARGETRQP